MENEAYLARTAYIRLQAIESLGIYEADDYRPWSWTNNIIMFLGIFF